MNDIPITMKKNGIDVYIRQEYSFGRVYGCYFVYRYGSYFRFVQKLARTHIPICSRKKLEEYVEKQTKALAEVYGFNTQKKQK